MTAIRVLAIALVCSLISGCALSAQEPRNPARRHMIAAANPHAARAGLEILRAGGSAVDAAIATQLVLGLVEPQSSGIGGGAFLMHFDSETGRIEAYDGRETAPRDIAPDVFLRPDGTRRPFLEAVVGGQSVGVPGVVRMLALAHEEHGRLPWARLFEPAIALAEKGFAISRQLHQYIGRAKHLADFRDTREYFFDEDGKPKAVGSILRNPQYATTLRWIAKGGPDAFYEGIIAAGIVAAIWSTETNPGRMTRADLARYEAKKRTPICRPYRQWRVCSMPPPTSGGVAVLQTLGMLERFDMSALPPISAEAVHLVAEASRLAFADRRAFIGDPDFVTVPVDGLLATKYLRARAALISPSKAMDVAAPGNPPEPKRKADSAIPEEPDSLELPSTSHLSIIDDDGNAVSMTTSIENIFGSRLMVHGFLLNNQLTDFSFYPKLNGRPVPNAVAPGKRPRSSMAPVLVFDPKGKLYLAIGSPGGSRIIGFVTKTLISVLDWKLALQTAISLPNFANRNGPTDIERKTGLVALKPALEAMGHKVRVRWMTSGLYGIRVTPDGLEGGADHRREGVAFGD